MAHKMQLSLFQLSVIEMEQNSEWCNSTRGVKKGGRLSTVNLIVLSFLSVSLMFLAHFDVLCDLQLYIAMVTWNQFVLFNKETKIVKVDITYVFVNSAMDYKYMRKPIKMHVEISLL